MGCEAKLLIDQEEIVKILRDKSKLEDIFSYGRMIGISKNDYYAPGMTLNMIIENFIEVVYQKEQQENLKEIINRQLSKRITISDRAADRFGKLFNIILDKLNTIDEKNYELAESKLIDPIEFEDKMRNKAKLSEDIVRLGIRIKPDISVLRRKANALDYNKYMKMIEKLSDYYINHICEQYPIGEFNADKRYRALNNALLSMVKEELYDEDDDIEDTVKGIIFDTIAHCLIFNN